jgi:tetratricopeptide (TPR) repeat protein
MAKRNKKPLTPSKQNDSAGEKSSPPSTSRHVGLQTLLFAATIFLSASLLFIVEPMFAKMVLPLFGGAPAVWNTCLVFYQAILLAGYLYAHLSMKWLGPRKQAALHLAVLFVPWIVLPIHVTQNWTPPPNAFPVPWVWMQLSLAVGLPFFVISASAPVLQAWFARIPGKSANDPYFLYGASNLGSLLALLSYPILIETNWGLIVQSWTWMIGYALLIALFGACAWRLWSSKAGSEDAASLESVPNETARNAEDADKPNFSRRLRWLLLSAIPSSLLLGVTSHLTVDIVSMPLLWVVPLALYLLTFVIVFARRPILAHRWMVRLQPYVLVAIAVCFIWKPYYATAMLSLGLLHLAAFFVTAMVCHGELAADRPSAGRLTEFYLWMSLGGVIGGLFNALAAPVLFSTVLEYPLMIAAACMVRPRLPAKRPESPYRELILPGVLLLIAGIIWAIRSTNICAGWNFIDMPIVMLIAVGLAALGAFFLRRRPLPFGLAMIALAGLSLWCAEPTTKLLHVERGFFGVLRVEYDPATNTNIFVHGLTHHGQQSLDEKQRREPLAYFHKQGPLGHVFRSLESRRPLKEIGVLGLGAGTIAAYGMPGERMTFYEIDAAVERIAREKDYFTYLADCRAKTEVIIGDARLSLVRDPERKFDLLIIDVFNSDAVPAHLLTSEALAVYTSHLSDRGVLAAHISSRYLNLEPILGRLAADAGLVARVFRDNENQSIVASNKSASDWVVMARRAKDLGPLITDPRWLPLSLGKGRLWTDDFSNIVDALQLDSSWAWLQTSSWLQSSSLREEAALGRKLANEGQLDEAIACFEKALEIDPNSAEIHSNLGSALALAGRNDEAIDHYRKSLAIRPNSVPTHNNLALILVRQKKFDEAIDHYLNSLKLDPQIVETYGYLGDALRSVGKLEDACGLYRKALELQPEWAQMHNNLAIALTQLGKFEEAISHWRKAVELDPQIAEAYRNWGGVSYIQGRRAEALELWQKGIRENPEDVTLLCLSAQVLATNGDAALRNGPAAVEFAQRADRLTGGKNAAVLDVLAASYAEAGRFPEAVETAQRALAAAENNPALSSAIQEKLKLYRAGSAFHEASPTSLPRPIMP